MGKCWFVAALMLLSSTNIAQAVLVIPREEKQVEPQILAQPMTSQLQAPCHEYSQKLESPCFESEVTADGYQIRKYAATSWAVTDVAMDDWNAAINNGFRNLFKYISGFNEGHQLIPMAVPVMTARSIDGVSVAFFLPSNFSKPPVPDPASQVRAVRAEEAWFAVAEFGGYATEAVFEQQTTALRDRLVRDKVPVQGDAPPRLAQFDSPFHFWSRHNQVWIKLAPPYKEAGPRPT